MFVPIVQATLNYSQDVVALLHSEIIILQFIS